MPPSGGVRVAIHMLSTGADMQAQETTFEKHYSVDELASAWGVSDDFVRRLFVHEPGVVVFFKYRPGKRTYRTLRIPSSVAERVHRRMRK
jgi:hypothetical protein